MTRLLQLNRHPCAGPVWTLGLDRRGLGAAAFCPDRGSGPPPPLASTEDVLARLMRELDLHRRRRTLTWVRVNPRADAFVPGAEDLAERTIAVLSALLRRHIGVTVTTRGDAGRAAHLITLARRYPGLVRVAVGAFTADRELIGQWERGTAPLGARFELARQLLKGGADVALELGPIVPLVNDADMALRQTLRAAARAGVQQIVPRWPVDGPDLLPRIAREVSPSSAKLLSGWFRMPRTDGSQLGTLAESVRQNALARVEAAAATLGQRVTVCRCTHRGGADRCFLTAPDPVARHQLELFRRPA